MALAQVLYRSEQWPSIRRAVNALMASSAWEVPRSVGGGVDGAKGKGGASPAVDWQSHHGKMSGAMTPCEPDMRLCQTSKGAHLSRACDIVETTVDETKISLYENTAMRSGENCYSARTRTKD